MVSTLPPELQPIITYLTAPQLLGIMFNWGLWGILTVQTFIYYLCFDDKTSVKCLVYGLYFLECIQTAISTWDAFQWFSVGWGDPAYLTMPLASPYDSPVMDAIISVCVQLFFCWRIFVLSKSRILPVIIAALSIAQSVLGVIVGIRSGQINDLSKLREFLIPELSAWLGGAALADVMIAVTMTFLLLNQRTEVRSTDFIIRRIITLTVETNALTASVAIVTLGLYVGQTEFPLFICPPYVLGKLYTNTLLVIFNNRVAMTRETRLRSNTNNQVDLRSLQPSTASTGRVPTFTSGRHIEVSVTQDFGTIAGTDDFSYNKHRDAENDFDKMDRKV